VRVQPQQCLRDWQRQQAVGVSSTWKGSPTFHCRGARSTYSSQGSVVHSCSATCGWYSQHVAVTRKLMKYLVFDLTNGVYRKFFVDGYSHVAANNIDIPGSKMLCKHMNTAIYICRGKTAKLPSLVLTLNLTGRVVSVHYCLRNSCHSWPLNYSLQQFIFS